MLTATAAMQLARPLTPQDVAQRRCEFYEVTAPIVKSMMTLAYLQPFKLTMDTDGRISHEILWEAEAKKAYDLGQESIDYWAGQLLRG